jgi:hypothetical protein
MRLRFRLCYSITTLLAITAIAAVGTKLWLAPRQFTVEIPPPPCDVGYSKTATYWARPGSDGTWIKEGLESIRDHFGNLELTEYENGKRNGSYKLIRGSDGRVLIEGQFVDDDRDGVWWNICYLPGQSHEESQYDRGRQIEQVVYFTNGETKRYVPDNPTGTRSNDNRFDSPFNDVPDNRSEVEASGLSENHFQTNPFSRPSVGAD